MGVTTLKLYTHGMQRTEKRVRERILFRLLRVRSGAYFGRQCIIDTLEFILKVSPAYLGFQKIE
jgi:hypothetical protein